MGLLKKIICEAILLESDVDVSNIDTALDNHDIVRINYESKTRDIASGERRIYPIAYGVSTAGNPVLRVYQPNGDTASHVPSWKLMRIDGITNWETTGEKFTTRDVPNLRLKPDDQMQFEYKSAFGGEKEKPDIDDTPITKKELNNIELRKNVTNAEPAQDNTVENPKSVDNSIQNTHIPSGIDKETPIAPANHPITKDSFETEPTEEPQEEEPKQSKEALPNEPIYQNDETGEEEPEEENDTENNNEDFDAEVKKVNSLMERINKLYNKGTKCLI